MAIKRYNATADTTITNAFKPDLITRGTGSNMGESDVLEVFSIYAHASTGSVEKSRALLKFPIDKILSDRNASSIPGSGSVKFFLRVFNVPHHQTLPKKFDMQILPISQSWSEGAGMDMEEYRDEDTANWIYRNDTKTQIEIGITNISIPEDVYIMLYHI